MVKDTVEKFNEEVQLLENVAIVGAIGAGIFLFLNPSLLVDTVEWIAEEFAKASAKFAEGLAVAVGKDIEAGVKGAAGYTVDALKNTVPNINSQEQKDYIKANPKQPILPILWG